MYSGSVILDRLTRWGGAAAVLLMFFMVHVKNITVLCISDSGHIEIEAAGSACCVRDADTSASALPQLIAAPDDCGACLDVLLAQDVARTARGIQALQKYFAPSRFVRDAISRCLTTIGDPDSSQSIPPLALTRSSVPAASLSTVIRC